MASLLVRFLNLVLAGLVSGIILGIWLGYNPENLSAGTYIEQQQNTILALNTLMPMLGLITILLTLASAYLQRKNRPVMGMLLTAAALLIITGLVTRFGNQPINALVMTWNKEVPPAHWTELRDQWWGWHQLRVLATLLAFGLIAWTACRKPQDGFSA